MKTREILMPNETLPVTFDELKVGEIYWLEVSDIDEKIIHYKADVLNQDIYDKLKPGTGLEWCIKWFRKPKSTLNNSI